MAKTKKMRKTKRTPLTFYARLRSWTYNEPLGRRVAKDPEFEEAMRHTMTTATAGGVFAEHVVRIRHGFRNPKKMHGWDAFDGTRPVEIKTERSRPSKCRLRANAKYGSKAKGTKDNKGTIYLKERPIVMHQGICHITGKFIYSLRLDTKQLPANCAFFRQLKKKNRWTALNHFIRYPDAYAVVFVNRELLMQHKSHMSRALYDVLVDYLLRASH